MRTPLTTREWLEDMRRFAGRDAQHATEVLDILDTAEAGGTIVASMVDRSPTGDTDIDTMIAMLDEHGAIEAFVDEQEGAAFQGKTTLDKLKAAIADYEARNDEYWDIRSICMDAGLINSGDRTTDIVPLLRMFLPVD